MIQSHAATSCSANGRNRAGRPSARCVAERRVGEKVPAASLAAAIRTIHRTEDRIHQCTPRRGSTTRHRTQAPARFAISWCAKAREIQWDYKNIVKRKGRLERLR